MAKEPIDLESVTSMFMDLVRIQHCSDKIITAMESFLLACLLPENKHRFRNLKPKFILRMLQVFKLHKQQHPEYTFELTLRSAVQSYICQIVPESKREEVLQLLYVCGNFVKS